MFQGTFAFEHVEGTRIYLTDEKKHGYELSLRNRKWYYLASLSTWTEEKYLPQRVEDFRIIKLPFLSLAKKIAIWQINRAVKKVNHRLIEYGANENDLGIEWDA